MQLTNLVGRQIGQYVLKELIGKGGMSAVYRARQESLNRDVAVKVMAPEFATDPTYSQRFVMEAKTAATLEHNNIIPVYDYGTQDGISYIVMRLLSGGTVGQRLAHRINRAAPLPTLNEANLLLREVSKALGYAHSRGVIHRDIKASNVMFDGQGDPYVVDFGIARVIQSNVSLTAENITIGTPTYMAPEQWHDRQLTPAVDQYALGVLMYYIVTGRLPFYGSNPAALMQQHLNEIAPLAHTLRATLPPKASEVIARAMAKDPNERFTNVSAFADSFEAAVRGVESANTDFFTFVLPETVVKPADLSAAPTASPQSAPAAPTVAREAVPAMPAVPTQANPAISSQPPTPTPPPTPAPRPQSAKRDNGMGWVIGGLAVLGLIGALFVFVLLPNLLPERTPTRTASTPEPTVAIGGIRINNTPGAATSAPQGAAGVPTQITVVGAVIGGNAPVRSGSGTTIHSELQTVVRAVAVNNAGVVVSAHADGKMRLWTSGTGASPLIVGEHSGVVNDVEISANGNVIISGGDDRTLRVWDGNGNYRGLLGGHTNAVRGVAVNADGTLAASASEDGSVRLWDVDGGQELAQLASGSVRYFDVAFSPDGTRLAAGNNSGQIRVWDVASRQPLQTLSGHGESVRSLVFSPDGARLVSSSTDDTVRVWDVGSGENIATMRGHSNDVWRVAFSPNGAQVASGGRDNNLRLWDAASGQQVGVFSGHSGWVLGVAFSPDGSTLITAGGDGTVRLWGIE